LAWEEQPVLQASRQAVEVEVLEQQPLVLPGAWKALAAPQASPFPAVFQFARYPFGLLPLLVSEGSTQRRGFNHIVSISVNAHSVEH
jgi:hypothetical protein